MFHLRLKCKGKLEADHYQWLISYVLNQRREELACDDYQWIELDNIVEDHKVGVTDFQEESLICRDLDLEYSFLFSQVYKLH